MSVAEKSFADRLVAQIKSKRSIVCIGLDPRIMEKSTIPIPILERNNHDANASIWEFNKGIIDATHHIAAVYKPQMAFYERYNALDALKKTIDYIHGKNGLVILDAKRNDIGSTSLAYAHAVFEHMKADALTVNSYLGIDGVAPFLKFIPNGKGIIMLLKTSNPSSGEFQDLFSLSLPEISAKTIEITGLPIPNLVLKRNYIQMTLLMKKWSDNTDLVGDSPYGAAGYSSIGGVVGATYPMQLKQIRELAPKNFILIPGYGAQGGTAEAIVHGVNADGLGAIVNASRSINFAYQSKNYEGKYGPDQFGEAAAQAAEDMRVDINAALEKVSKIAY